MSSYLLDTTLVSLSPASDGLSATLYGKFSSDDQDTRINAVEVLATLQVKEQPPGAPAIIGNLAVSLGRVHAFKPMRVKISMMDDRTARDLFGSVTAREFMIANVRMFNDLDKDGHGTPLGASVLAFSASIDVGITLQKRRLRTNGSPAQSSRDWEDVTDDDLMRLGATFGYTTDDCGGKPPDGDRAEILSRMESAKKEADALATAQGATQAQKDTALERSKRLENEIVRLRTRSQGCPPGFLSYRPYTYEVMLNSVDPRDRRAPRSRILRAAEAVGVLASFVNAVAITPGRTKLPTYLDKYGNMLIPGYSKIFSSLKETERQNVVSMTMKPIEEIPYGSDLERKLFFPKGSITGVLKDHEVRIVELDPFRFAMRVAVLDKSATSTVTAASAPQPR